MRAQLQVKTRLALLLFLMLLLTVLAVGMGWSSTGPSRGAGQSGYVLVVVVVLAVLLAALSYLTVVRKAVDPMRRMAALLENLSQGNLTNDIQMRGTDEPGQMFANAKKLQDALALAVGNVRDGIAHIDYDIKQLVSSNTDLSSRTEQQNYALQQTVTSVEQLSGTVRQNADHAQQANQLALVASQVAQRGGDAVGEVVSTMQVISTSSHKIADIVRVIDSIAFQTNILALNAAVEAARAGEQGKGFAVVASEVRALAQRSAHAAKEIKDLIEDSVQKVSEGSGQVERAGATMEEIVSSVARVTDIMGEISAATTEQAEGIDRINQAIGQMDGMTQQNAALVRRSTDVATDLDGRVGSVSRAMLGFKLDHATVDYSDRVTSTAGAATKAATARAHAGTAPSASASAARTHASSAPSASAARLGAPRQTAKPVKALASAGKASAPAAQSSAPPAAPGARRAEQKAAPTEPAKRYTTPNETHKEDDWEEF